jgi:hypothetical protein
MRPAPLRQGKPFTRDTAVRTCFPCRHGKAKKSQRIVFFSFS